MILSVLLTSSFINASDVGGKTTLRKLNNTETSTHWKAIVQPKSDTVLTEAKKNSNPQNSASINNLSSSLVRSPSPAIEEPQKVVIVSKFGANPTLITAGDIIECIISQDILGYVGSLSPIRADITDGQYSGYSFIGNATMDPKTKSIVIEFNKMRSTDKKDFFDIKATVHSVTGEVGLVGTHNSHYWRYFFASVLSRGAQGYAEGIIERDRNILGQYVNVPNTENSGKIAVAQAGQQTADLLAEQMKQAPEYTTLKGPILTKVFVMESPKLNLRR